MKKYVYSATGVALCASLLLSCQSENLIDDVSANEKKTTIINSDQSYLKGRVDQGNIGLLPIETRVSTEGSANARTSEATASSWFVPSGNSRYSLAYIAEIRSLSWEGLALSATHIAVDNERAYVTYNTEGNDYLGGIQVINISNIDNPILEREIVLRGHDVSAAKVENGRVLLAGALNIDSKYGVATPAWYSSINTGDLLSNSFNFDNKYQLFPGYVGMDIAASPSANYAVSGSNGVITKFNKDGSKAGREIAVADLRSVYADGSHVITLSGASGVGIYDHNLNLQRSISLSQDLEGSKRTLDVSNNHLFVAEGQRGFGVYNLGTTAAVSKEAIPSHVIDGTIPERERVTNAIAINNNRVFAANGGVGVSVYDFNSSNQLSYLGTIKSTSLGGSSNYVVSKDNYVLVASGKGGVKVLKLVDAPAQNNSNSCNGNYPSYVKTQDWEEYGFNLNSGEVKAYSGNTTFTKNGSAINVNDRAHLTWCGELTVHNLHANSGSKFDLYGTLNSRSLHVNGVANINGTATLENELTVNSGGTLNLNGAILVGKAGVSGWSNINGNLVINGNVTFYSNLTINSGAKITLNNGAKLTVHGNLTNNGTVTGGTITHIK